MTAGATEPTPQEPMGARGAMLSAACEALHGLEKRGELRRDALLSRLPAEDLPYLYAEVQPDRWYPMETVDRLWGLVREVSGADAVLVERGRCLARLLLERPIVREMEGARQDASAIWWSRPGHLLVALPSSLFTHTSWRLLPEDEPGRFTLEVTDAAGLPEAVRFGVQGAVEEVAARVAGRGVRVESDRPEGDRIVYQGRPAPAA